MRDWIENGLAQGSWLRDRPNEFARSGDLNSDELNRHLQETWQHCRGLAAQVGEAEWEQQRSFRNKSFSVRQILLHQVEHVAYHAGQAAFLRWLVGGLEPQPL